MIELNRVGYLSSAGDQQIFDHLADARGSNSGLSDGNRVMLPLTVTP
jgi:hypothetical protein